MALNFWFGKKEAKTDQAMVGGVLLVLSRQVGRVPNRLLHLCR